MVDGFGGVIFMAEGIFFLWPSKGEVLGLQAGTDAEKHQLAGRLPNLLGQF
ncbi:MAG TPA: hypothetical protein VE868_01820 [Balneolaceae bacterium]|nr:hypothetical protein [Balneolaceae bacterium]